MARSGDRPSPLFSFTAYSAFTGLVVGVALFIIWSIWVVSPGLLALEPPSLKVAALVLLFDLVLLSVGCVGLLTGVWSMRFFDGEFTVRARGLEKAFAYSQMTDVHIYLVFSGVRRRSVLRMDILGDKSFTITGNPWNKVLNTDLYHWLKERTLHEAGSAQAPEGVISST